MLGLQHRALSPEHKRVCSAPPEHRRPNMGDPQAQRLDALVTKFGISIEEMGVNEYWTDERRTLIMNLPLGCGEMVLKR